MAKIAMKIEDFSAHLARLKLVIVKPRFTPAAPRDDAVCVTSERHASRKNPYIATISLAPCTRADMVKRIEKAAAKLEPEPPQLPSAGRQRAMRRGR